MTFDDLTLIKGVGPYKARLLIDNGFKTFEDIHRADLSKIAGIPTFGEYNALMIKESVMDFVDDHSLNDQEMKPVWNRKLTKAKRKIVRMKSLLKKTAKKIDKKSPVEFDKLIRQVEKVTAGTKAEIKEAAVKELKAVSRYVKNLGENPSKKAVKKALAKIQKARKTLKTLRKK